MLRCEGEGTLTKPPCRHNLQHDRFQRFPPRRDRRRVAAVGLRGIATVGGGQANVASGPHSTVPGGQSNLAGGPWSFAAGVQASATHGGSFVWSGSSEGFASTAASQFLIRAPGGVGIGTAEPESALDVAGVVTATGLVVSTAPSVGHVLTSDADGLATWQAPQGGGGGGCSSRQTA